jgi:lantibiotic transport system permease protein
MFAVIVAETLKLRRSLVLLLVAGAPACLAIFAAMIVLMSKGVMPWARYLQEVVAIWAYFLLPLSLSALAILFAQIEHVPKMWNHLLVLPVARGKLFLAKAVVMIVLLLLMQLTVFIALVCTGLAIEAIWTGRQLSGEAPLAQLAGVLSAMTVASLLILGIQLWLALRIKSFVPPFLIGIAGTFFGLMVTALQQSIYIPWFLQIYSLAWPRAKAQVAALVGLIGGLAVLSLMLIDLSRREHT